MRQVILDTETTGLEVDKGHKIIEVGCVELVNRKLTGNHYHRYINPEREVDQGAIEVHGITLQNLLDKPIFANIATELLNFIAGAELIIHNADFDLGFLNAEFKFLDGKFEGIESICGIIDTLQLARHRHPGQRNSLDALCERYSVDNSQRDLHGALLDAEILADVYLSMTGGQTSLGLSDISEKIEGFHNGVDNEPKKLTIKSRKLLVIRPSSVELAEHEKYLSHLDSNSLKLWEKL